jgi:hypothetical protein
MIKQGPWRAVDANNGTWRCKMEPWRAYRPVVEDSRTLMRSRIRFKEKSWTMILLPYLRDCHEMDLAFDYMYG